MDYTVALFLERIPGSAIRKVTIGGVEQPCLCLPIDPQVFYMAKSGKRFLQIALRERDSAYSGTETHNVYFSYPGGQEVVKKERQERRCGKCFMSQPFSLNQDTANTSDYEGYGVICLDDLDEDAIFTNPVTGKRYIRLGLKPLDKLDRSGNTTLAFVDPRFGADKGRRGSLANGYDSPLIEVGRFRQTEGAGAPADSPDGEAVQAPEQPQSKIGKYDL